MRELSSRLIAVGGICLVASSLVALDDEFGGFSDLRLNMQAYGVAYDVAFLGTDEESGFDTTYRFGVTWIASLGLTPGGHGGLMIGLGLNYGFMSGELGNGSPVELKTWTGQGYAGWGWQLGKNLQLEVLPTVGFGRAKMNITNTSAGIYDQDGNDKLVEYGLINNLVWTLKNDVQLGAQFGYMHSETNITDKQAGIEFDWNNSNFTIGFILGARL